MTREIVTAIDSRGAQSRFLLSVFEEAGRWTSTLERLDEHGQPSTDRVAPRFYGLSHEQARRRMLTVLENQFDDLRTEPA